MRVLSFSGTPQAIGEAFGESCRDSIHELYRLRLGNAIGQAREYGGREVGEAQVLAVAAACVAPTRAHHPDGFAEIEGIARGSGLTTIQVLAMNGLTDIRDVLAWGGELEALGGCSAFLVQGDSTANGKLIGGQTWDLATDNMPHVVAVRREVEGGPTTWALTTVGCLSLIGLNEHGLAVGTTNIRTTDARPGVTYLSLIHKALASRDRISALSAIERAPRAGAHFYWLAMAGDFPGCEGRERAYALECTPEHVEHLEIEAGAHVHTNHCQIPQHRAIEGNTPSASSHARFDRLSSLIGEDRGHADLGAAKRWLSDRANGENAISRTDFGGISSNGAVVIEPSSRTIHVGHGPPHLIGASDWIDLRT
ncbi:C45 family autoproteolytic acyltransferase/hydrolase [Nannocystaceae bacterium ST9]